MVYILIDVDNAVRKECKRRYSERTIETYLYCIHRFLNYCKKDLGKISKKDVRLFLEMLSEKERAGNTMNTYHMAIKFLFEDVLDRRMWIDIHYSKTPKKLPLVLTKEEIKVIFSNIKNGKHRLMIELLYASGLRVSELLNLKIQDLELEKGFGYVRKGKGNKDRLFIIPERLTHKIDHLVFIENLDKQSYLFKSDRNKRYSARTIQQIIKKASKTAGIDKKIHPHTFRHSFATHLIDDGYSVSQVQSLLGHKNPETTFTYLHSSPANMIDIKSPLDSL